MKYYLSSLNAYFPLFNFCVRCPDSPTGYSCDLEQMRCIRSSLSSSLRRPLVALLGGRPNSQKVAPESFTAPQSREAVDPEVTQLEAFVSLFARDRVRPRALPLLRMSRVYFDRLVYLIISYSIRTKIQNQIFTAVLIFWMIIILCLFSCSEWTFRVASERRVSRSSVGMPRFQHVLRARGRRVRLLSPSERRLLLRQRALL